MLHTPEKTDFSPKEKIYDTYGKIKFSNEKKLTPISKTNSQPKETFKTKKTTFQIKKKFTSV